MLYVTEAIAVRPNAKKFEGERILYGVQGEGRGHATRSLEIIKALLEQGYAVKVLSGGDALPVLRGAGLEVFEIPLIRYQYTQAGYLSMWKTIAFNAAKAFGLLLRKGKVYAQVHREVMAFSPDLCISDFEPYLSRIARAARMPLVAIDHQHFLTETLLPRPDRLGKALALGLYRLGTLLLGGRPDRIIASSFWHFPRRPGSRALLVGPFFAAGLRDIQPTLGEGVVVYLKRAGYLHALLPAIQASPEIEFTVFSLWSPESRPQSMPANVTLRSVHREAFLTALGSSRCLITTAGNQVIGEAVYLGKPVLAFPEPEVLEQELNATALENSGFGQACPLRELDGHRLAAFFAALPHFRERMRKFRPSMEAYDGRKQTLKALHRFLRAQTQRRQPVLAATRPQLRPAFIG
jgi:uncharacterized protein (TIGR00661 family)